MQATVRGDKWIRCPFCGHKLFKLKGNSEASGEKRHITLEIKCHSCKEIFDIRVLSETEI